MVKITFLPDLSCVRDGQVQRGVDQPEPGRDGDGQVGDPEELRQGRNLLSNSQRRQHLAKSYARCNKRFISLFMTEQLEIKFNVLILKKKESNLEL